MAPRIFFFFLLILATSCGDGNKKYRSREEKPLRDVKVPPFSADSAYFFTRKQVEFGPRIPGTPAHTNAGNYFTATLKEFGAAVVTQEFEAVSFDGRKLKLKNIIGSYFPDKQKRILLAAHWDTRPFADKDKEKPNATFDGANDGASGVAVLLETARILGNATTAPDVGVDLILFDGEDWGEKIGTGGPALPVHLQEWWCLGSQYWAKNKHRKNYTAYFGILLDMVGGKDGQFYREGYSMEFAPGIVDKVWNMADRLGYGHVFVKRDQEGIIDDHLFVNKIGKIPMIDIIPYDPATRSFGDFHHSRKDNLEMISAKTLAAVGETVLHVVYHEQ